VPSTTHRFGMALVGLEGRWLKTNESLCEILGYSAPEMLELNFQELTHPDDLNASMEWVRRLVAGELRSFSHEKRYLRRVGSYVWASLSVSLVHDAVQGYLELVLDGASGNLSNEQRQHLATVSRNSERLLRLVSDLLFVAQTDAGKLELIVGDVDLARLARESVESARPPAAAKGIRLEVSADELPLLRGDRARRAQLLDNLVSNALKFTLDGGSVTVSLVRAGDNAVLEVRDTGMGSRLPSKHSCSNASSARAVRPSRRSRVPASGCRS
jgi:PAS domain S-box-containing protein